MAGRLWDIAPKVVCLFVPIAAFSGEMGDTFSLSDAPDHPEKDFGVIPWSGEPAFSVTSEAGSPLPILIGVPHAGRDYPDEIMARLRQPDLARLKLEDRFVDLVGRRAAAQTGVAIQIANAPRAMIDLNRSVDDIDYTMVQGSAGKPSRRTSANRRSRHGLGLIPRRVSGLGELWRKPHSLAEIDARVAGIYEPYHSSIARQLEAIRDVWGVALLVDLHSMPPLPQQGHAEKPAEFVIGDRYARSCASELSALALDTLGGLGRRAVLNRPYSGGYILDRFGRPRQNIHAIQIEVCRSSYLDTNLDLPSARLPAVARILGNTIQELGKALIDQHSNIAEAAE